MEAWHEVCNEESVRAGEPFGAKIGEAHVALFRLDGQVYATHGVCTHAFALLEKGFIEGDSIECPLHEGRFDIRTGKCLARPPSRDLRVYPVQLENGKVMVRLDAQVAPTRTADKA